MLAESSYPRRRTKRAQYAAWTAATIITVLLLAQLFTFEDLPYIFAGALPLSDERLLFILAAKIVILELFALPYLLAMRLSPLMRIVSAVCGLIVALSWLVISFLAAGAMSTGMLGSVIDIPLLPSVLVSTTLLGLLVYVQIKQPKRTS